MEFKGTKGKWIFNQDEMKIKGSGDIEGLIVIANVSPKMDYSRGMTTQTANAKLIAASPEMFEMLKYILKEDLFYQDGKDSHRTRLIKQLLTKITE